MLLHVFDDSQTGTKNKFTCTEFFLPICYLKYFKYPAASNFFLVVKKDISAIKKHEMESSGLKFIANKLSLILKKRFLNIFYDR